MPSNSKKIRKLSDSAEITLFHISIPYFGFSYIEPNYTLSLYVEPNYTLSLFIEPNYTLSLFIEPTYTLS